MQTSHSAVDASPRSVPSEVDADRDGDGVGIQSNCCNKPYDELYEILSWLPAKSAIKYSSSICKWLCNIHSEPRFIKKQCIHSCGQDNGFFLQNVVGSYYYYGVPNNIDLHVLPGETESVLGIPCESLDYLPKQGHILSSSNGLLLLGLRTHQSVKFHFPGSIRTNSLDGFKLMVCNPATREWAPLGIPEGFKVMIRKDFMPLIECYPWGHGVDFPNDYTIAIPAKAERPKPQLEIYFLDYLLLEQRDCEEENKQPQLLMYCNGRWEEELCDVNIEGRVVSYDVPVAVFSDATKGLMVHYICHSNNESHSDHYPKDRDPIYLEPYIAAFDIREKKLAREIKLPEEAWHIRIDRWWGGSLKKLWIFKWNETSICLVKWRMYWDRIGVWVLDNYGCEGESWRMIMNPRAKEFGVDDDSDILTSVRVVSGGRLLISTEERLYVYTLEGEHRGKVEVVLDHGISWSDFTCIPYANTLRPVSVQNVDTLTY